ncbi:uncharacterized protein [Parasteatoda tepidariorum]|uniref:uncharacterized protein n=1 Tax=Parasteatoda tepidariorum TaxID=114398 RepID=UPI001C7269E2|nr:uncharacterized protein LOC107449320 [Parasteatoda tepidariorum]
MDTQKILLFTLALFCFDLSDSAPVFNGLLKDTNASNKYEEDFRSEVSVVSDNVTAYNVSKDDLMNNLTNGDLPLVLQEKSTLKIGGKGKTGGGGSKSNKGGSKGGGRITIYRPIRKYNHSSGDSTITYIMIGWLGFLGVGVGIALWISKRCEKNEDENIEMVNKNKDNSQGEKEKVNKKESNEKDKKEESEMILKKNEEHTCNNNKYCSIKY